MNIIVTGANGFIGNTLINFLTNKRNNVLAIDFCFDKSKFENKKFIKFLKIPISKLNDLNLRKFKNRYSIIYHLAWQGVHDSEKKDSLVQLNNIKSTIECLNFAKKINVKKILISGSITEELVKLLNSLKTTTPTMLYASAKYCNRIFVETICKHLNINYVWMSFANIYGPSIKHGTLLSYAISRLNKNKEAIFGPAESYYDFIYIDDLIYAIYKLGIINNKSNYYYIGSGKPRKLKSFLHSVGKIYNKSNLIKIGIREDDFLRYPLSVFNVDKLKAEIGDFVKKNFEENIKFTIKNFNN